MLRYDDFPIFFLNGGRSPSWNCFARVCTIDEEYLVVLITVQNFFKT